MICTYDDPSYAGAYRWYKGVNHSAKQHANGATCANETKSVWALLKRGLTRTYRNINVKHLFCYVDEFVFRLNEGKCEVDIINRMKLLIKF